MHWSRKKTTRKGRFFFFFFFFFSLGSCWLCLTLPHSNEESGGWRGPIGSSGCPFDWPHAFATAARLQLGLTVILGDFGAAQYVDEVLDGLRGKRLAAVALQTSACSTADVSDASWWWVEEGGSRGGCDRGFAHRESLASARAGARLIVHAEGGYAVAPIADGVLGTDGCYDTVTTLLQNSDPAYRGEFEARLFRGLMGLGDGAAEGSRFQRWTRSSSRSSASDGSCDDS